MNPQCTQYARYVRFCYHVGVVPCGFVRFLSDVYPFTSF